MDLIELKSRLENQPDKLISLLESVGFFKVRQDRTNKLRFAFDEDSDPTAIVLNIENLLFTDFKSGESGDIINLLMKKRGDSFGYTIRYITTFFGWSNIEKQKEKCLPFSGYYSKIYKRIKTNIDEEPLSPLNETVFHQYSKFCSLPFIKDGISAQVQHKFGIHYDHMTCRVLIPWRDLQGNLVGFSGRYNSPDWKKLNEPKYLVIYPFSKGKTLFGFDLAYDSIMKTKKLYIFESEKSVLQCHTLGIENVVALGCHSLSPYQVKIIKSLQLDEIILCFDEGIEEEYLKKEVEKLKFSSLFLSNKLGYIFDGSNKYLEKGSKNSPSDCGGKYLNHLLKECVYYI